MHLSAILPQLGLSALCLCLFSGLVLAFYYRPSGNVFQNVEEITTLVPYGWFFRQLHYGSGQVFVILMLIHTMDHLVKRRYRIFSPGEWTHLMISLILCLFVLFTGFMLKGDKEGLFAAEIFTNIMKAMPFVGVGLADLFIRPGEHLLFLPYLYHCVLVPAFILYLIRAHIREWLPERGLFVMALLGLSLYALIVEPAKDIPPEAQADLVKGPWFFLAVQSLLKTMPILVSGLILPGAFWACLLILPLIGGRRGIKGIGFLEQIVYYGVCGALAGYSLLTLRAAVWAP